MTDAPSISHALQEVLRCAGLPESNAAQVSFSGRDPVFPTQYKAVTAGSAALGALALAMADIREIQTGQRPSIHIDAGGAAASLRGSKYVWLDGNRPIARDTMAGFYRAAHDRWNYFHCAHPPHQAALLKVLGTLPNKEEVAAAAARWDAFELENAVHEAGGLAPVVRTPQEWRTLPNTLAVAAEPLVKIEKIGESEPIPLPTGGPGVLSGIKMLDLTRVLAGPTCGRMFAENGADVLKITCDRHPDTEGLEWGTGYGKRKLTLDISSPPDKASFIELLKECDVFSQAYRPCALAQLGFGPDQVKALRPGIVYVNLNAFGYTGEWRMRRGYDTVVQAASGMAHVSGRGGAPKFLSMSALDYTAGYLLTFGALVALKRRQETGGSYAVKVSLARCAEWLMSMGLHDSETADSGLETPDISDWLVEVPTPLGKLKRLRPIIRYSDECMNQLPQWRDSAGTAAGWHA